MEQDHNEQDFEDDISDDVINPNHVTTLSEERTLQLTFVSFGHKHGLPDDTYQNFNLRKLPHPEVEGKRLKDMTGLDPDLQEQFFSLPQIQEYYTTVKGLIQEILDNYDEDDELRIGLGCHSGKHRSVAIVEKLSSESWQTKDWPTITVLKEHPHMYLKGNKNRKNDRTKNRDKKYSNNHDN
jgi:RNase adaptor protein for sRNA GlmZ degradation